MASSIRAFLYNAAGHDQEIAVGDIKLKGLAKDQLLWIDGTSGELKALTHLPSEISDALSMAYGSASLEIYKDIYRFFVPTLLKKPNGKAEPLRFIVGKSWLLTVSDPRPPFMDTFVETDRGETLNGKLTPSAMAAALMSELLDHYRSEIAVIDKAIDELDDSILTTRERQTPLNTLAALRRRVSRLRVALGDTSTTIHALTRPDFFAHIDPADHVHFESIGRTLERLEDAVARARETVIGSFDLYTTRVAQDTNQLVKALTITTVITGIIGAAAGIFGMNFDTPFMHSGIEGFIVVTAAMILSAVAIVLFAIWRRWF